MRELGDSEKIFHSAGGWGGGGMWGRGVLEGDVAHAKVRDSLLGQSPGTFLELGFRLH